MLLGALQTVWKFLINLFEKTHYVSLFSNRSKKGNLLLIKK